MKLFKKLLAGVLFCAVPVLLFSQDFSNKGKDFWVIYTGHVDGTNSRMALYITSDQNASGTVTVNGNVINFTVTANQVTTVRFTSSSSPSNAVAYNGQTVGIGTNKGIHIQSDKPVVVYSHILNAARSGSSLVLPTNVLGREYYVASYASVNAATGVRRSEFAVAATQDNTTIEITPRQADANNTYSANVPFQVTLNKGDVFQYQSGNDGDLTGTYIKSIATATSPCKPIAVFAGSTWTAMGCPGAGSGDNLYQQLFPFVSWGKYYITAPFKERSFDIFRILVRDPATIVQVNGVTLSPATLIAGRFYEFNTAGNNTPRIITSNQPICVMQYMITENCDGVQSDPEMIILNSIEQTLNDITVLSARSDLTPPNTNITRHFLNIIVKTSALGSLTIDGAPYSSAPVAIPATQYSYLQQEVTNSTNVNPSHRVKCDSGFVAIAYGYGNVESYGYNAGANVRDLYQYISILNQFATVSFPATCKNAPFYFRTVFPYNPTQIQWVFGSALNTMGIADVTINSPVYDSTWTVNGRQVYRYSLPIQYSIHTIGTYPIKIIAYNPSSDGCSGEQEIDYDLQVFNPPSAGFYFTANGCVTSPVDFFDTSGAGGRGIIQWNWNFGDAGTSLIQNPSHSYATSGTYLTKLSVITDIGCISDTATKNITLTQLPQAKFSINIPSCAGKAITFTDLSTVNGGSSIAKWYWDFGDGSPVVIVTNNSPQIHTYTSIGSYNATLKVETNTGCQSFVFTRPVTINLLPEAGFIAPEVCLADPSAPFIDTSKISGGNITTWQWNFGDPNANAGNPNTSNLQNPSHRYTVVGNYTATLIAISNNGCTDTISKTFTVNGSIPLANFTVQNANALCSNKIVTIADASTVDFGGIVKTEIYWDWTSDPTIKTIDDIPSPGKLYTHTYPEFGSPVTKTVTIRMISYSGISCLNVLTKTIILLATPILHFDALSEVCSNAEPFQITQAGVANGIQGTGTFSGPGVSASGLFDPTVATAGIHTIRYTFTGANSCGNYMEQTITVNPTPKAFAGPDKIVLEGGAVQLTPALNAGFPVTYIWTPPTGLNNPNVPDPLSSPADDITYTLKVTSDKGCTTSDQVFVKVLKKPEIPNIFSPNGDGIHDRWVIKALDTYPGCTVEIFNRYGQQIYYSVGYSNPWDGTINGKPVPVGTYYYIVDPKNGRQKQAGYVDIVR
ncbi:MAG TPA: PKD domain-containing protein [Chitinophagaceae bacterium]|nr:PKD domain-containing protein [Chitinophagaceae bacterium]